MSAQPGRGRRIALFVLATAYALAGVAHLTRPSGFVAITPGWVPAPAIVVALTGVAELAGAAGIGLALYALCVWPANFNHALNDIPLSGTHLSWWYHGPRLALQPLLIWWPLWASGVIDWSWRKDRV